MSAIISGIQTGAKALQNAITPVTSNVQRLLNWAGTKIDTVTYTVLPRSAARVVSASLKALPVTAGIVLYASQPTRVIQIAALGITASFLGAKRLDVVFGAPMRKAVYRGISDSLFVIGAQNVKSFVTSKNTQALKNSLMYGLLGVASWLRANSPAMQAQAETTQRRRPLRA